MLAYIHTYIHTYIHKYVCIYIYTYTYVIPVLSSTSPPPPDVRSPTWRLQNYHRSRESHPIHDNDNVDDDDGDAYGDAATTRSILYIYI